MAVTAIQAAEDVLDRAERILALDMSGTSDAVREDLRRMAWAMGSAAIDTYFHWRVRAVDLNNPLPKALRQLEVPFGDLVDSGKRSISARHDGTKDRPTVRDRNTLHRSILSATYQSSNGIEKALAMVGAKKPWTSVAQTLGSSTADVREHVDRIAHRRNRIVHEGDIERLSRPQRVKHTPMSASEVVDELAWIRVFLTAVNANV